MPIQKGVSWKTSQTLGRLTTPWQPLAYTGTTNTSSFIVIRPIPNMCQHINVVEWEGSSGYGNPGVLSSGVDSRQGTLVGFSQLWRVIQRMLIFVSVRRIKGSSSSSITARNLRGQERVKIAFAVSGDWQIQGSVGMSQDGQVQHRSK